MVFCVSDTSPGQFLDMDRLIIDDLNTANGDPWVIT